VEEGSVGAGTGATVGKLYGIERAMRGGLGVARVERDGVVTAALMVVNAVGDVRDPVTGRLIAGARDAADGRRLVDSAAALEAGAPPPGFRPVNTTIGVVATTAALGKAEAARVARLGLQGFEVALSPPHLPTDGDALFCLSVGDARTDLASLGRAAAEAVAAAIARAVLCATPLPGLPSAREIEAQNS
jgi:L-aminopeptidase/D-esterase-like protein